MRALRGIRLTWGHLAVIAVASLAASAVIIAGGGNRSYAELAALAALHHPGTLKVVGSQDPPQTKPGGGSDSNPGGGNSQGGQKSSGGKTQHSGGGDGNSGKTGGKSTGKSHHKTNSTPPPPDAGLPKVKHVFLIALSTPTYKAAFDDKKNAPYLKSLAKRGALLTHFKSLGAGSELADYIAMIGGQKPNKDTSLGCPKLTQFSHPKIDKHSNVSGAGCLYPQSVPSIGYQAAYESQTWGAYIEDQGNNCEHVNPGASQAEPIPGTKNGYDTLHNPFVYFDGSLSDGSCSASDFDLSALPKALKKASLTPNFVYVAPNACADGSPQLEGSGTGTGTTTTTTTTVGTSTGTTTTPSSTTPSVDNEICPTGQPSGIAAEDAFLKTWVPKILASAAYHDDGVLVIAFAGSSAKHSTGGVRTGALVISKYTKHAARISKPFGPYSLLRSVSDMLNYPSEAQASTAKSFAKLILR